MRSFFATLAYSLRYWLYDRGFLATAIHRDKTQQVNTYYELFCHHLTFFSCNVKLQRQHIIANTEYFSLKYFSEHAIYLYELQI